MAEESERHRKEGDQEAMAAAAIEPSLAAPVELEQLFQAHHVRALKAAYRITGSMSDAEDVAQAVFLRIAQRHAYREAIANPESYIYRAAVNAALDLLRRRRREAAVPLEDVDPVSARRLPDQDWETVETRAWLRQALAGLSPRTAEMFALRYIEDYSNREVARLLGTSPAVVAVLLHRARARLRSEFRAFLRGKS